MEARPKPPDRRTDMADPARSRSWISSIVSTRRSASARQIDVEQTPDGPRLNLSGEEAELLVRHRGEPLKALQHVVDMAYGRGLDGEKRRVRRRARLSEGQGHRAAADGEAAGRESQSRRASISSSARSIPTSGASSTLPSPRSRASRPRASATRSRKRSSFPCENRAPQFLTWHQRSNAANHA